MAKPDELMRELDERTSWSREANISALLAANLVPNATAKGGRYGGM
jgi:hypothetical protein